MRRRPSKRARQKPGPAATYVNDRREAFVAEYCGEPVDLAGLTPEVRRFLLQGGDRYPSNAQVFDNMSDLLTEVGLRPPSKPLGINLNVSAPMPTLEQL